MKNIILKIVAFICLLSFTNNFKAQSVSLTIACPGTVTAGSTINVDATYGYSNITGNITVVVNYDDTKVHFCGSALFAIAPSITGLGTASASLIYVIPASPGLNQTGAIQIHFCAICPQTCFGSSNIANFSGNISAPGATAVTSNSCGTNLNVINDWGGYMNPQYYNCKTNQLTFQLVVYRSSCYKINNPTLTIGTSVGTLLSSSAGTISGSTINLGASLFSTIVVNITIQLPCTYRSGPVNCSAILNGDNCGVFTSNLHTYTSSYNISPKDDSAVINCSATATEYTVNVTNNGDVPINASLSSVLPNLNYTGFTHSTNQPSLNGNYLTYDCPSGTTGPSPFVSIPAFAIETFSGTINKMDYNITNLAPGKTFTITFNYVGSSPSCIPAATIPYNFSTTGSYVGVIDPSACNCTYLPHTFASCASTFTKAPNFYCQYPNYTTEDNTFCHRAGEVVHYCIKVRNYGNADLINGIIDLHLPSFLNINTSSLTYDGSSSGISVTSGGIITLPTPIAFGTLVHTICFDATINTLAINGSHAYTPTITGTNMIAVHNLCDYNIKICQEPKAEISKLVKGSEDAVFSTSGSAMAPSIATYRITVKNTGNTPISSIEVVDRLPEPGDNFIRGCSTPRLSAFSVLPNGIFPAVPTYTPLLPTAITYDNSSPASVNKVPSTWLPFLPSYTCDLPGSFTSLPLQNTVHVNIPSPILPFSDYTFDMQVVIPATAKPGEQICNSVALKTKYMDDSGLEHDLEIIESDKVCLTIAPPPCKPCPEMVKSETLTINPGTTTSATQPYVVKTGFVTITTLKPVQEIHINVSDLQYHFNKPECTNCKTPALSRGGIFPLTTTQTVGTLDWYDYTGSSIPTTTPIDNLPEELVWKLGVMLAPGTYTIPFQLTLPKSIIPDCCELIVDKFALKVSVKDVDCNLCESFLQPSTDNCCTGGEWASKQMTWSNIIYDRADFINKKSGQSKKQQNDYNEAVENNKLIKSGIIIANPLPLFGVLDISCGETYHIMEGSNRTFNGVFKCNPNMKNCISESLVTITTISGNYINVVNQPMPFNQIFNLPGVYTIKFTGKCNGTVCNECEYKLIVDKNCCAGIVKKTPTNITANHIFGSNTTTTLTFPPIPHYTAYSTAMVHIDYSCVQGCSSSYTWVRKRAGVVIASGSSSSSNINFAPPSSGEDLIQITAQCGTQNCYKTEQFYLGCEFCTIVGSGHHGGM